MRWLTLVLLLVLAEFTSYLGYFFTWASEVGFFVIAAVVLLLSLRRLEYGLFFVLADLILGGKSGALFSFEYQGFTLSIRMAIFIVVMAVWAGRIIDAWRHNYFRFSLKMRRGDWRVLKWWGVLGLAMVWGIAVGLARRNDFGNLFLDANGYFYAALILPTWWCITRDQQGSDVASAPVLKGLGAVFFTTTTLLALKTLFSVYLFTHGLNNFIAANLVPFYRWIRDTGVGEITWLEGNFARIFFQSHIYSLAALFILLATRSVLGFPRYILIALNTTALAVNLSRSIWVGLFVGFIALAIGQGLILHRRGVARLARDGTVAIFGAFLIIIVVARFPWPRPSAIDLTQATQSRFALEAGASSRWNLLPPLVRQGLAHPLVGSGFGTTVTYTSNDPRIREVDLAGVYTTYAFEWGWLDTWVKMGVFGLLALIALLGSLAWRFYRELHISWVPSALGLLFALAAVHFFTPYLNHPLGFGTLIGLTMLTYFLPRNGDNL